MNQEVDDQGIKIQNDFFKILFRPYEHLCVSPNVYGTEVTPIGSLMDDDLYFSINPLKAGTKRADANVTCYRNILLEFDEGTKQQQFDTFKNIPYTSATWSGGKSYHVIISLAEPCETRSEYDALVRRIYDRVPGLDRSCKNPSRFSRVPEAIRPDGKVQAITMIKLQPVSRIALEAWLGPDVAEEAGVETVTYTAKPLHRILRADTWYFLSEGAPKGEWNRQLFLACIDMCRAGFPNEEIMQRCADVTGKLTASDKRTISSAIKIVKAEK